MKLKLFIINLLALIIISCGSGNTTSTTNYYSASLNSYYQIVTTNSSESGSSAPTTYSLNVVTNTGSSIKNLPLTQTSNGYTFSGMVNGTNISGTIVINNGQMGISFTSTNSYADFATINTNRNNIPSGSYSTVCDQNNLSACIISINNNQISIVEYSVSGVPTALCNNQKLVQASSNAINPNVYSFTCGVQGGASSGTWSAIPLIVNGVTGIMISEYDASINANDNITDEIAFIQESFIPSGNYNYEYNSSSGQGGISSATFNNGTLINATVGSCAGAACAIIQGQYAGAVGLSGNPMVGFDYYSVNGTTNYNLVGNTTMNIFDDSYAGIYY